MSRNAALALTVVLFLQGLSIAAGAPPQAVMKPPGAPPTIDGRLEDSCWKIARPFSDFILVGGQGKASVATRVKACFDSKWLYFGIACEHPNPARIAPKITRHDGRVHTDESVEIFLDPGTKGMFYGHFMLNAANVRAEQSSVGGSRDRSWDPQWRSATRIHATGWNAEVAIPLYILSGHGDIGQMRVNVARNAGGEASTWGPVSGTFHDAGAFGRLRGMGGVTPDIPYLAFANVHVGRYYESAGRLGYDVTLNVGGGTTSRRDASATM
jgi:hypothetical protein